MRLIDADALRQVLEVFTEKDTLGHTPLQLCDAMPAASPWHRVEEEMPEKFVNVILANKRGKHYDIDKGWWNGYSFDRCAKGIYRNVTHWMPLPEPPKEGE